VRGDKVRYRGKRGIAGQRLSGHDHEDMTFSSEVESGLTGVKKQPSHMGRATILHDGRETRIVLGGGGKVAQAVTCKKDMKG